MVAAVSVPVSSHPPPIIHNPMFCLFICRKWQESLTDQEVFILVQEVAWVELFGGVCGGGSSQHSGWKRTEARLGKMMVPCREKLVWLQEPQVTQHLALTAG